MSGEAWLYLLAVLINAVNLFLQVFFTIMYSDLEWYGFSYLTADDQHPFVQAKSFLFAIERKSDNCAVRLLICAAAAITSTLSIFATVSMPTLFLKLVSTLSLPFSS
jgi:exosortase/archaeosortase